MLGGSGGACLSAEAADDYLESFLSCRQRFIYPTSIVETSESVSNG